MMLILFDHIRRQILREYTFLYNRSTGHVSGKVAAFLCFRYVSNLYIFFFKNLWNITTLHLVFYSPSLLASDQQTFQVPIQTRKRNETARSEVSICYSCALYAVNQKESKIHASIMRAHTPSHTHKNTRKLGYWICPIITSKGDMFSFSNLVVCHFICWELPV